MHCTGNVTRTDGWSGLDNLNQSRGGQLCIPGIMSNILIERKVFKRSCYEIPLCGLYRIKIYRKHPKEAKTTFPFVSYKKRLMSH